MKNGNAKLKKNKILKMLRDNYSVLSKYPNGWKSLFFKKIETNEKLELVEVDIHVRHQYENYISLARRLYGADIYGEVRQGAFGSNDFSYIAALKVIIKQMEQDGYLKLAKQKPIFFTEFGKTVEPDGNGDICERYISAEKFFLDDEKELLETAILLTTKGQNKFSFWVDKIISEPVGVVAILLSIASLLFSIVGE